jgi:hypothetical protein
MTTTQKRRKPGTVKALASGLGITRRATQQALALGCPDTLPEARLWREDRQTGDNSAQRLRQERIALVIEQRKKAEIENAALRGELVPARESYEAAVLMGYALKAQLQKFMSDVTPSLEGLTCGQIYKRLREGLHGILLSVSGETYDSPEFQDIMENFRKSHPENWTPNKKTP